MADEQFFEAATESADISIDVDKRALEVCGKKFQFRLSQVGKELHDHGAISSAFRRFGTRLFKVMTSLRYSHKGESQNNATGGKA